MYEVLRNEALRLELLQTRSTGAIKETHEVQNLNFSNFRAASVAQVQSVHLISRFVFFEDLKFKPLNSLQPSPCKRTIFRPFDQAIDQPVPVLPFRPGLFRRPRKRLIMEFDLKNKQQSGRQFDPAKCTFDDQPTDQLLNGDPNDLCDKMKLSRGELMLVLSWDLRDRLVANFNRHSKLLYSSETVADDLRKKMVEDNNELLQQLINLPSTAGSQCPSTGVQFKLDWSLRNRILVGGMKNHLAIKEPANELLKEKAFSDDLIEENNTLISALHNLAVREHEPAKQQKDQGETLGRFSVGITLNILSPISFKCFVEEVIFSRPHSLSSNGLFQWPPSDDLLTRFLLIRLFPHPKQQTVRMATSPVLVPRHRPVYRLSGQQHQVSRPVRHSLGLFSSSK